MNWIECTKDNRIFLWLPFLFCFYNFVGSTVNLHVPIVKIAVLRGPDLCSNMKTFRVYLVVSKGQGISKIYVLTKNKTQNKLCHISTALTCLFSSLCRFRIQNISKNFFKIYVCTNLYPSLSLQWTSYNAICHAICQINMCQIYMCRHSQVKLKQHVLTKYNSIWPIITTLRIYFVLDKVYVGIQGKRPSYHVKNEKS